MYKRSYAVAMEAYEISKTFPPEEKFALTGQIRRCTRSVCQNLREAWAKRRYEAHFISKLTDCDAENTGTDTCLDFALGCDDITVDTHKRLTAMVHEIGKMLGGMINNPDGFVRRGR